MRKMIHKMGLELKDIYRIVFIATIGATIVFCYLHTDVVDGKRVFTPIIPNKQWWGFASYILFHGITSKVQNYIPKPFIHALGMVTLSCIIVAGLGEYFNFEVGSQLSTTVGSLLGVFSGLNSRKKGA